jgi:hypothetical protein
MVRTEDGQQAVIRTCETCYCEVRLSNWQGHQEWHSDLRGW